MKTRAMYLLDAVEAHTNLNTFGAIVALLEGGTLYGPMRERDAAQRIIRICKTEMLLQLRKFDLARDRTMRAK